MLKLEIRGASHVHVGEPDKPNEDTMWDDEDNGFVFLADGVTQMRDQDGHYPKGTHLAQQALRNAVWHAATAAGFEPSEDAMRHIFAQANQALWKFNAERGALDNLDYFAVDYFSSSAVALWFPHRENRALLAFLGDSLAFHLPVQGRPEIINRDQLDPYHRVRSRTENQAGQKLRGNLNHTIWRNHYVRNNSDMIWGGENIGFGILTGEPQALDLLEIRQIPFQQGDRFILASDAIRICAQSVETETAESFSQVWEAIRGLSATTSAGRWIELIREAERAKNGRSDDATVIVIDVL